MMAEFAVIEDNKIINLIVADDKETAELVSGKACIEFDIQTIRPVIGWDIVDGVIIDPSTIVEETPVE